MWVKEPDQHVAFSEYFITRRFFAKFKSKNGEILKNPKNNFKILSFASIRCKTVSPFPMNLTEMTKRRLSDNPDELVPTRQSLLERLRDLGDNAAWQEFFDTYWKLLYCAAVKSGLSDHDAEEVVQETVIGVARKMESFRYQPETCSFKGWLMLITRRRIIDRLRKRQSQPGPFAPPACEEETEHYGNVPEIRDEDAERAFADLWEDEWRKNLVDAATEKVRRRVKPEHYQIFYMHKVKNMPVRTIGKLLGVSSAKIYVVGHRVARMLKKEIRSIEER